MSIPVDLLCLRLGPYRLVCGEVRRGFSSSIRRCPPKRELPLSAVRKVPGGSGTGHAGAGSGSDQSGRRRMDSSGAARDASAGAFLAAMYRAVRPWRCPCSTNCFIFSFGRTCDERHRLHWPAASSGGRSRDLSGQRDDDHRYDARLGVEESGIRDREWRYRTSQLIIAISVRRPLSETGQQSTGE